MGGHTLSLFPLRCRSPTKHRKEERRGQEDGERHFGAFRADEGAFSTVFSFSGPGKPFCPGPAGERAGLCAADGPGQDGLPGRFLLAGPASLLDLLIWALRPGSGKPGPAKRAGRARHGSDRAGRGPSRARPGPAPHFANRPVSHPISPTRPRRPQLRAGPGGGGPYWSCPPLARPRATAGDPAAANPPHLHPAAS